MAETRQFMRRLLFGPLMGIALTVTGVAHATAWRDSLEQAQREASQTGRLLLLHFWSEQCGPCMRLESRVLSQPACQRALQTNYVPVKINVLQHPELAQQFQVDRIPMDIILTPDGRQLHRSISPSDLNRYVGMLDQVAAHARIGHRPEPTPSYHQAPSVPVATTPPVRDPQPGPTLPPAAEPRPAVGNQPAVVHNPFVGPPNRETPHSEKTPPADVERMASHAPVTAPAGPNPMAIPQAVSAQSAARAFPTAVESLPPGVPAGPHPANLARSEPQPPAAAWDRPLSRYSQPAVEAGVPAAPRTAGIVSHQAAVAPPTNFKAPTGAGVQPTGLEQSSEPTTESRYFQEAALAPQPSKAPAHYTLDAPPRPTWQPREAAEPARQATPPQTPPSAVRPWSSTAPLGLDGYCPVTLVEQNTWRKGNPSWVASHEGRLYLFAGPNELQAFQQNPHRYAPVLAGFDVVRFHEQKELVPGKRQHGVAYRGRYYLFADEEALQRFWQNPTRYAEAPPLMALRPEETLTR
ncbi:MAG: hypothetical protein KatS3mg110_1674 [Pirellulaceae bacterium]|nr:MAG: hypothetical protein KatS3mg110_1674 [Pirellulaceae bacterium]